MATAKMGRPSDYLEEVADDICSLLANGESLKTICERPGMPSRNTAYRWLRENQDFRDNYARATEDRADAMFEDILTIADTVKADPVEIAKAKLKIDTRKWVLSRMNPQKFSDQQSLDITTQGESINKPTTIELVCPNVKSPD